jgi:hypothetical protein
MGLILNFRSFKNFENFPFSITGFQPVTSRIFIPLRAFTYSQDRPEMNDPVGETYLNKPSNPDTTSPLTPLLIKERGIYLYHRIGLSGISQQDHEFQG